MSIAAAPAAAQSYTVLRGFEIPSFPSAVLVQGSDGDFYGTTHGGGANGYGTVFKITPAGELTTLHSFAGFPAGAGPDAGLVQGSDGDFYGTTGGGGAGSYGTVFKITPAGELTTLYSFAGNDGAFPRGPLVQVSDGDFYGTTPGGGASGYGTVFKIRPTGELTTLHSFAGFPVGSSPGAPLVQGTDGDFYGTTGGGGANGAGTVFKITPAGELTILYSFVGFPDGSGSGAGLAQATDGNFYGTTGGGGVFGLGTIFKITPAGELTTLYSFKRIEGAHPYAGLIQATDGNFYGTTFDGGAS
ncbi:MAG TPA: choice-of-anchor tandem repeat GloVer-containing protein, partial [Thermoanaerobaculia bacterium]|nr:choice-of-anchor tandem repeat GloVer-containing protein [Thermoanaerobaculia bacterium]